MNATTLRLGNVLFDHDGKLCNVYELHTDKFCTTINGFKQDPENIRQFKPIQLTKEWLLKFGGIILCDNDFIFDRFILLYKKAYNFWTVYDLNTLAYITKVEFVHEWQNVFFVLNGVELTIKK